MKSWELKCLDSFGELTSSKRIYLSDYVSEGVPFYRSKEIIEKSEGNDISTPLFIDEKKFYEIKDKFGAPSAGDILITAVGTLGVIYRVKDNDFFYFKDGNLIWLRKIKQHINSSFLFHLLSSKVGKSWLDETAIGSSQPAYTIANLKKIKFPIPPIPIQNKIAAILSAYDDLIENNKRRITLLEKMAEEIYREWFVRLRFPGYEKIRVVKGVPEGWEEKKLSEIVELCYGKALKAEERVAGDYPVFGSSGVVGTHHKPLVNGPGIIVGRKGNVGSVHWCECGFFPIDTAYYVKSTITLHYLFYLLQSMNFINNDAAVPGLNRNQAYSNLLLLPPDSVINEFSAKAKQLFELRDNLSKQNEQLTQSRDSLLPRLISGKLSVENLDIQFPPGMGETIKVPPPLAGGG